MVQAPPTRASLLVRIRDSHDTVAWQQFLDIYSSLVYGFLRKRGIQDADAADLMQDVFRSVASAVGRLDYDPARGTFRSWLFTITRNKLNTFLDRRRRQPVGTGDTSMQERLEGHLPQFDENSWETEYQQRVFDWAIEQVKPNFGETVWQAFWQTAVEGKSAQDVATRLGMSVGAVYVAKSRVLAQIREQVQGIDTES